MLNVVNTAKFAVFCTVFANNPGGDGIFANTMFTNLFINVFITSEFNLKIFNISSFVCFFFILSKNFFIFRLALKINVNCLSNSF